VVSALALLVPIAASAHVVLHKRDVRGAIGWVGLIWLVPGIGALLYLLLGINRIRREARALRRGRPRYHAPVHVEPITADGIEEPKNDVGESLRPLVRLIGRVVARPLLPGNRVEMLVNGDQAYPAMLEAIERAQVSITMATYIFDNDPIGRQFAEALGRARERGVHVRVLVDAAGARYSTPSIMGVLRRQGVRAVRFLPTWLPWRVPFFNLRNHRKTLVVDGRTAFAGGMNVREGHVLGRPSRRPVRDLHFRIEGPVVSHIQAIFAEDWKFAAREGLEGERWFPKLVAVGTMAARGIADGPDEDFDQMRWAFLGALACARRSVRIMTPYFLPDTDLLSALEVTALRGVEVTVVVPGRSNIRVIDWAMWGTLSRLLEHGCRVVLSRAPFDHSKVLVVDEAWALFGSANWDPRSLRLNFELGVECFDEGLASVLARHVDHECAEGRPLHVDDIRRRGIAARLRDGAARLLTPYL
jgi:cardiolipin synthase